MDAEWQARSNRPHKTPDCSAEVEQLVDLGVEALREQNYPLAVQYFQQSAQRPTGNCKELLDNCAMACLMAFDNHACLVHATNCIKLDPKFPFGYLHRARAYRCLQMFDHAIADLTAALELRTVNSPDICREIRLTALEQSNRVVNGCTPPPNHTQVLGVSNRLDKAEITRAYKILAVKWHPDKWINNGNPTLDPPAPNPRSLHPLVSTTSTSSTLCLYRIKEPKSVLGGSAVRPICLCALHPWAIQTWQHCVVIGCHLLQPGLK